MDVIFLDFRCVNLILNDVKGANTSGKLLLIFWLFVIIIIIFFCFSIEFTKLQQYQRTVDAIRSQIIGINIRKVNTVNEPKKDN